jgi:hypothetical protein
MSSARSEPRKPAAVSFFQGVVTANPNFGLNPRLHDSPRKSEEKEI